MTAHPDLPGGKATRAQPPLLEATNRTSTFVNIEKIEMIE
jgi:hypothetical protein